MSFGVLFVITMVIVIAVVAIRWSNQKEKIGTIRCKRCDYVGPSKGLWVPFRGMKPVCSKCDSDDWVAVDKDSINCEREE